MSKPTFHAPYTARLVGCLPALPETVIEFARTKSVHGFSPHEMDSWENHLRESRWVWEVQTVDRRGIWEPKR